MQYKAFFSYSRQDERLAKWLWKRLDAYKTPNDLVGTEGRLGEVPRTLHRIFRDRSDLGSGGKVGDGLDEALTDSERLIVLCTPASAKSGWVDHEVRTFVGLGRSDRIFPVIGSGEPNSADPKTECFPPSLRDAGILAADLREIKLANGSIVGDGKDTGALKLIAGLLGIPLDTLVRRESKRQRTTIRNLAVAVTVFLSVAVVAIFAGFLAYSNQLRAERRLDLAARASIESTLAVSTVRSVIENQSFADSRRNQKMVGGTSYSALLDELTATDEFQSISTTDQIELWKAESLIELALEPGWLDVFNKREEWLSDAEYILNDLSSDEIQAEEIEAARQALDVARASLGSNEEGNSSRLLAIDPLYPDVSSCVAMHIETELNPIKVGSQLEYAIVAKNGSRILAFDVNSEGTSIFDLGITSDTAPSIDLYAGPPLGVGNLFVFGLDPDTRIVQNSDPNTMLARLLLSSHIHNCSPTNIRYEIVD